MRRENERKNNRFSLFGLYREKKSGKIARSKKDGAEGVNMMLPSYDIELKYILG